MKPSSQRHFQDYQESMQSYYSSWGNEASLALAFFGKLARTQIEFEANFPTESEQIMEACRIKQLTSEYIALMEDGIEDRQALDRMFSEEHKTWLPIQRLDICGTDFEGVAEDRFNDLKSANFNYTLRKFPR